MYPPFLICYPVPDLQGCPDPVRYRGTNKLQFFDSNKIIFPSGNRILLTKANRYFLAAFFFIPQSQGCYFAINICMSYHLNGYINRNNISHLLYCLRFYLNVCLNPFQYLSPLSTRTPVRFYITKNASSCKGVSPWKSIPRLTSPIYDSLYYILNLMISCAIMGHHYFRKMQHEMQHGFLNRL